MSQPTPQQAFAATAQVQITQYANSLCDHFAQLFPGASLHFAVEARLESAPDTGPDATPLDAPVTAQEAQEAASTPETPLDTSLDITQES